MSDEKSEELSLPTSRAAIPDPEFYKQMLDVQFEELHVRTLEANRGIKKDEHNRITSLASIEASLVDKNGDRELMEVVTTRVLRLFTIIALGLMGFGVVAIIYGKEVIVIEIVKAIIFLVAGSATTWGLTKKAPTQK